MLTSLRAILRSAARSLGVERAANAALIAEMWPEIVGAEAAAHSRTGGIRGTVLLAEAETGLWAQELSAQRGRFVQEINRRLGAEVLSEIRFRQAGPTGAPDLAPRPDQPADPAAAEGALSAAEVLAVDRAVGEIADPEIREAARNAMISQLRWRKRGNQ